LYLIQYYVTLSSIPISLTAVSEPLPGVTGGGGAPALSPTLTPTFEPEFIISLLPGSNYQYNTASTLGLNTTNNNYLQCFGQGLLKLIKNSSFQLINYNSPVALANVANAASIVIYKLQHDN